MLRKTLITFLFIYSQKLPAEKHSILLNPAGHAKSLGRNVFGDYERGVTLKIAFELQKSLLEKGIFQVALTRKPGDELNELSLVSFVNQFAPSVYLSLHVYGEDLPKPKIFFYYLVYNPLIDMYSKPSDELEFTSIYKAHFKSLPISSRIANSLAEVFLQSPYDKYFECGGAYGLPFRPLRGILQPAIAIEIGLCNQKDLKSLINVLAEAINNCLSIFFIV
jgi:N-acetylmuramoyl-L-alanine amidase